MSGHKTKDCYKKKPNTCFEYGEAGHIKSYCPKLKKPEGTGPKPAEGVKKNARAFVLYTHEAAGHVILARLLPMTLAGFDIVQGMDSLASNQARILCDKKAIELHSPQGNTITVMVINYPTLLE
ncbi:hypothetical protein L1987_60220 [Smallanthus sonchifolius]|uniref:Uncharacterized protein n=1 Tax=Smallanthus sonchifolius TaxID=185202 RepID=A0ACB9D7V8_9ASTR|nr:hypothetical protein L1987_60220 [Smallanthus sonchifolius]